jgi:hypothetical protein
LFKPDQYPKVQVIYIVIVAIFWSLYAYNRGVVMSPDSGRHSIWADTLLKYNFNIFKFLGDVEFQVPPTFYYNWVIIVSLSKSLLGENSGLGIVVLNLLAGIFVALLLFKTIWTITGKPACTIFAGLLLLLCQDFFLWIPFVLSEILYSSLCFSIFILTLSFYQQHSEYLKRVIGVVILLCYAIFFRPAWPPLLMFAILSIIIAFLFNWAETDPNKRHNFIIRCAFLACILIPTIIFIHSYLMLYPDKWPFPFLENVLSMVSNDYQRGIVLYAHSETYHPPPSNFLDYAFISPHKMVAYFYISVDSYSFKHSLFNYIFFLPVYCLSIIAVVKLFKKDSGLSSLNWWYIFSCTLFIFSFSFFHALEQIDFDFRYRVPCLPPLILLASLGLNELINDISRRALKRLKIQ